MSTQDGDADRAEREPEDIEAAAVPQLVQHEFDSAWLAAAFGVLAVRIRLMVNEDLDMFGVCALAYRDEEGLPAGGMAIAYLHDAAEDVSRAYLKALCAVASSLGGENIAWPTPIRKRNGATEQFS